MKIKRMVEKIIGLILLSIGPSFSVVIFITAITRRVGVEIAAIALVVAIIVVICGYFGTSLVESRS